MKGTPHAGTTVNKFQYKEHMSVQGVKHQCRTSWDKLLVSWGHTWLPEWKYDKSNACNGTIARNMSHHIVTLTYDAHNNTNSCMMVNNKFNQPV